MAHASIVIPTYQRHRILARTLERLEQQTVDLSAFEVIVVADAKEEDLPGLDAAIGGRPFEVRRLAAEVPGVSAARNRGWPEARAPLILFIGDDMLPEPQLLAEHLAWHERHPEEEVAVLGHVRWASELRRTPFMDFLERGVQFNYLTIKGTDAGWGRFYAANASLKRGLMERSGGYDEEFCFGYEELDLAYRLRDLGMRLLYNRNAVVEHLHPPTIRGWQRRMELVAVAERQFVRKHPDVPPFFYNMFKYAHECPRLYGQGPSDVRYRQALAPAFLAAWEACARQEESELAGSAQPSSSAE